jgi:hypothetical protein
MHRGLHKPAQRDAMGYPSTRSSPLINPEILSKQPRPPLWILTVALVLIAIDTAGIHWFVGVLIYQNFRQKKVG